MIMQLTDSLSAEIILMCENGHKQKKEIPVEFFYKPVNSIEEYQSLVRKLRKAVHLLNNGYDSDPFKAQHEEGFFHEDFHLIIKSCEDFRSKDVDDMPEKTYSESLKDDPETAKPKTGLLQADRDNPKAKNGLLSNFAEPLSSKQKTCSVFHETGIF